MTSTPSHARAFKRSRSVIIIVTFLSSEISKSRVSFSLLYQVTFLPFDDESCRIQKRNLTQLKSLRVFIGEILSLSLSLSARTHKKELSSVVQCTSCFDNFIGAN